MNFSRSDTSHADTSHDSQDRKDAGAHTLSARPLSALESLDAARADVLQLERELEKREHNAQTLAQLADAAREAAETARHDAERAQIAAQASEREALIERDAARGHAARLHDELAHLRLELSSACADILQLRAGHDDLGRQCADLNRETESLCAERDRLTGERDALSVQCDHSNDERARFQVEAQTLREQLVEVREHLEAQRAESETERARADEEQKQAVEQTRRSEQLRHEVAELHHDLVASDVPTLILRAAMKLTGAEQGLFTDESGECVIASVGMDDLPPTVQRGIFEYTKQAMRDEQPIVRNDGENLPDGAGCVNLAALPVAVQNEANGAILVANKRSGPFDDDDTQVLISIGRHAGIALQNQKLHLQLEDSYRATIAVLADAIEAKDPYTRGHCESVSRLAVAVAAELGCSRDELERVRYAALLHDVGKIGVSDGVLLKPGKLLPEEFGLIQRHAAIGADLARRVPALSHVVPLILHHHEKIDGSGYPNGLSGDGIPLGARIIGAVDAFDAMTTPRPYRSAVEPQEALDELQRCAGTQFDAGVVNVLARVWREQFKGERFPLSETSSNLH